MLPPPTATPQGKWISMIQVGFLGFADAIKGTTAKCYAWHIVTPGDSCANVESSASITLDQLRKWNPDLKADCTNLLLGEAYCVKGG